MKARVLLAHRARRVFFFIHLWLGLIIGIWFSLIGLSGSVLAWRFELQGWELSQRFPIEKNANGGEMIPLSQAMNAFKTAYPDATPKELAGITIPNRKMPFYSFSRGSSKANRKTIVVDPYSAKVHPPIQMRTLTVGTIQQFHERLLSGAKGYVFNGFLNFLAIPLVLSGLWLWWPTKLKHLKTHLTVKRGVSLKRTLHDLHGVLGIYLYPILLLVTVTGAMMVQQHIRADGGISGYLKENQPPPAKAALAKVEKPTTKNPKKAEAPEVTPQGQRISADELLALSRRARPQWELTRVELPQRSTQALELTYAKTAGFTLSETIFLNPYDGSEIAFQLEPERTPVRRWSKTLHLGEYGGVFTKTIYTVAGLMPLGLFLTGILLWWRKKRDKGKKAVANR